MADEPDTGAFSQFVAARYPALVRSAFLLTGDRSLAEDAVQSALIKTMAAWARLDDVGAAETYTRTTLVRLIGRWGRRRWRGEIPTDRLPDVARIDAAEHVIDSVDVRVALGALPWEQRAVLVLRFFDDLAEREVAATLGCSVGTVKSRTSRGLAALRAAGVLRTAESPETEARHG